MTRRTLDLSDDAWQWLEDRATEAKMIYKGRPSRTAYLEALARVDSKDTPAPPVPLAQGKTASYEDAVEGLAHYQQNVLLKQHPGQPAALKRFYELVVGDE